VGRKNHRMLPASVISGWAACEVFKGEAEVGTAPIEYW
jgi:hypothetical protein